MAMNKWIPESNPMILRQSRKAASTQDGGEKA